MEFHVITLFPEMFAALDAGLIGRARQQGIIAVHAHNLREHGLGNYRQVDDTPYGGGSGMVMRPEPIASAIDSVTADRPGLLKIDVTKGWTIGFTSWSIARFPSVTTSSAAVKWPRWS
jgi:tRNA (guanine37-N1)-methyltransferase